MNEANENLSENSKQSTQEPQIEQIAYEQPEVENEPNKKMMVFAVMVLCLMVFVMVGLSFLNKKETKEAIKTQIQIGTTDIKNKNFELPQKKEIVQKNFDKVDEPKEQQQLSASTNSISKTDPFLQQETQKQIFKPKVFKTSSSLEIVANGTKNKDDAYVPDQNMSWAQQTRQFEEEQEFQNDTFTPKIAVKDNFNPSLMLQKGTYIGCSLNTRLVSQIKGGISCTVSENIYSKDGVTLLIEKGSKIFGSFRSGEMNDGMNRIFVVWSEIRTPNNINIPVQSGASDELGGSGMQGYVDHQWMKRFGASILLSMIDDVFNYAANGKRDNSYDYGENTRDATQQMANTALEEFIKIKPVLYRNQGDIVGVYVNRDIDFSKVYKLKVGKRK